MPPIPLQDLDKVPKAASPRFCLTDCGDCPQCTAYLHNPKRFREIGEQLLKEHIFDIEPDPLQLALGYKDIEEELAEAEACIEEGRRPKTGNFRFSADEEIEPSTPGSEVPDLADLAAPLQAVEAAEAIQAQSKKVVKVLPPLEGPRGQYHPPRIVFENSEQFQRAKRLSDQAQMVVANKNLPASEMFPKVTFSDVVTVVCIILAVVFLLLLWLCSAETLLATCNPTVSEQMLFSFLFLGGFALANAFLYWTMIRLTLPLPHRWVFLVLLLAFTALNALVPLLNFRDCSSLYSDPQDRLRRYTVALSLIPLGLLLLYIFKFSLWCDRLRHVEHARQRQLIEDSSKVEFVNKHKIVWDSVAKIQPAAPRTLEDLRPFVVATDLTSQDDDDAQVAAFAAAAQAQLVSQGKKEVVVVKEEALTGFSGVIIRIYRSIMKVLNATVLALRKLTLGGPTRLGVALIPLGHTEPPPTHYTTTSLVLCVLCGLLVVQVYVCLGFMAAFRSVSATVETTVDFLLLHGVVLMWAGLSAIVHRIADWIITHFDDQVQTRISVMVDFVLDMLYYTFLRSMSTGFTEYWCYVVLVLLYTVVEFLELPFQGYRRWFNTVKILSSSFATKPDVPLSEGEVEGAFKIHTLRIVRKTYFRSFAKVLTSILWMVLTSWYTYGFNSPNWGEQPTLSEWTRFTSYGVLSLAFDTIIHFVYWEFLTYNHTPEMTSLGLAAVNLRGRTLPWACVVAASFCTQLVVLDRLAV